LLIKKPWQFRSTEIFNQQSAIGSGITFGSDPQLPKDRSMLRDLPTSKGPLSEGQVVRIVAFVIDAHGSNLSGGESVNCKQNGAENNDIHIVLGEPVGQKGPSSDECLSVTAEMSPHFRPEVWTPDALNQHNTHLYRFTGQLFFDASHRPCVGGKGSPKRRSLWEIHPVYAVDICMDTNNNCKIDSDENWVSFAEEGAGAQRNAALAPGRNVEQSRVSALHAASTRSLKPQRADRVV
jgi:hypothetical protein